LLDRFCGFRLLHGSGLFLFSTHDDINWASKVRKRMICQPTTKAVG
jgi:hypothetical protein